METSVIIAERYSRESSSSLGYDQYPETINRTGQEFNLRETERANDLTMSREKQIESEFK